MTLPPWRLPDLIASASVATLQAEWRTLLCQWPYISTPETADEAPNWPPIARGTTDLLDTCGRLAGALTVLHSALTDLNTLATHGGSDG